MSSLERSNPVGIVNYAAAALPALAVGVATLHGLVKRINVIMWSNQKNIDNCLFDHNLNEWDFKQKFPNEAARSLGFVQQVDCGTPITMAEATYQALDKMRKDFGNFFSEIFCRSTSFGQKPEKESFQKEFYERVYEESIELIASLEKQVQSLKLLGLTSEDFTREKCRKAFRSLALQYHPDKPGGSIEKMLELQEAFYVLQCDFRPGHRSGFSENQNEQRELT